MITSRKLLLLALVLLLISAGIVVAQSSATYLSQRSVTLSGSTADSEHYAVTSVIGQPSTGQSESENYGVSSGFLYPVQPGWGFEISIPLILK